MYPRTLRSSLFVVTATMLVKWAPVCAWRMTNASFPSPEIPSGLEDIDIAVGCGTLTYPTDPTVSDASTSSSIVPTFSYVLSNPLATFLSVRFAHLNLPPNDFVLVRPTHFSSNETQSFTYRSGVHVAPFFSDELTTNSITIELYTVSGNADAVDAFACKGFAVDQYRYFATAANAVGAALEEVCGTDDSREAACFKMFPTAFERSGAVLRMLTHKKSGSFFCTGWLVGCEGHVLTNHHCIESQDQASDTKFEFQALGDSCSTACDKPFGCKGKERGWKAQLVVTNEALDYALVKLDENLSGEFGYLQMRESGAVAGERIYVPQHPSGWGKRIAMKTDDDWGTVESLTQGGCLPNQVAYSLDTQGGSSGSPVLAWSDNAVVGLHHCGGCPNTAVNMRDIVADLRAKGVLPQCAVV